LNSKYLRFAYRTRPIVLKKSFGASRPPIDAKFVSFSEVELASFAFFAFNLLGDTCAFPDTAFEIFCVPVNHNKYMIKFNYSVL
jgi:hypothetical protein